MEEIIKHAAKPTAKAMGSVKDMSRGDFMNPVEIGKRIKEQRTIADITQEQLGAPLGLNKSTIQRYETGQVDRIKLPILQEIAKILNVNPDWLACKTDMKTEYPTSPPPTNHSKNLASWMIGWESNAGSGDSDLKTAITMQGLDRAIKQQGANTYIIHGSDGKGTVVTTNIPKDKYLLVGEGDISELTKKEYRALKSVLDAMHVSSDED